METKLFQPGSLATPSSHTFSRSSDIPSTTRINRSANTSTFSITKQVDIQNRPPRHPNQNHSTTSVAEVNHTTVPDGADIVKDSIVSDDVAGNISTPSNVNDQIESLSKRLKERLGNSSIA